MSSNRNGKGVARLSLSRAGVKKSPAKAAVTKVVTEARDLDVTISGVPVTRGSEGAYRSSRVDTQLRGRHELEGLKALTEGLMRRGAMVGSARVTSGAMAVRWMCARIGAELDAAESEESDEVGGG
jgi:hypothetical protein